MIPKPVSAAAEEEEEETEEDDSQIIDLEGINGKKLAVLGGALLFADVLSGLLTGLQVNIRSRFPWISGHCTIS